MRHLAILRQPFLDMILSGEKTIESRWSMHKIAPYNKLSIGDEILLKETSKDVIANAKVKDFKYFELTPQLADEIKQKYGKEIGVYKFENWENYRNKKYCTLIWLENVERVKPFKVKRSNGAGWIVIN